MFDPTLKITNDGQNNPSSPEILDPEGNKYSPDNSNYMFTGCLDHRDNFTDDQVTVMKNHIASHPTLQPFHSTKGVLTCDCDYEKIIYLRNDVNWSDVINNQILPPNTLENYEIVVEGTLTMDVDYTFRGAVFTMGPGAEIDIISGADITIEDDSNGSRSVLMACEKRWRGIHVAGNASLALINSDIYETFTAIEAVDKATLEVDNIVIINSHDYGIKINGDVILAYDRVKILDSGIGVLLQNSPQYYNISNSEIVDCNQGIKMIKASGTISQLSAGNILVPINLTEAHGFMIEDCALGYDLIGIVVNNTISGTIINTTIGTEYQYGYEGIRIRNSNNLHIHNNPKIIAEQFGIRGMQLFQVDIFNNPDISISGIQNTMSGGLFLTTATECDVTDNYIYASEVAHGIESNNGVENSFRNNYISISSIPNLFRSAAIRSVGSISEEIIENETYSSDNANGILAQNTAFGHYVCNYIYDSHDALCIEHNSDFHELITNHKIDAHNFDFVTRSKLGDQINHGNVYEGGSVRGFFNMPSDYSQSLFEVEPLPFHMPSDPVYFINGVLGNNAWYATNLNNDDFCSGTVGPGSNVFFSSVQKLCDYWDDIKALKSIDPELFIVKVTHLIRYFDAHPLLAIPDCIALDPVFINVCGLHEIMDGVNRLSQNGAIHPSSSSLQVQISDMLVLHQEYINSADPTLKANKFSEIATAYTQARPALDAETQADEAELQIIKNDISSVSCSDLIIQMMRDVWKAYISELGIDSYNGILRVDASLAGISQQCSDEYGDAIHLARSIVSMQGSDTYYDTYDGCNDVGYSSPRNVVMRKLEMMISPNPTSGIISIEFTQATSGRVEIYSMDGILGKTLSIDKSNNVLLDIEKSGIHFIRYIQNNGNVISKMVISIK